MRSEAGRLEKDRETLSVKVLRVVAVRDRSEDIVNVAEFKFTL
jgi:hypothetical protein